MKKILKTLDKIAEFLFFFSLFLNPIFSLINLFLIIGFLIKPENELFYYWLFGLISAIILMSCFNWVRRK